MRIVMTRAAQLLLPVGLVAARLLLDEGLSEMEKAIRSLIRKRAERFVQAHAKS